MQVSVLSFHVSPLSNYAEKVGQGDKVSSGGAWVLGLCMWCERSRPFFSNSGLSLWCLSSRRMEFPTEHVNSTLGQVKPCKWCWKLICLGFFLSTYNAPFKMGLQVWGGLSSELGADQL